jgi:hypothetical protein
MKSLFFCVVLMLAFCAIAAAQVTDSITQIDVYSVNYYSNRNNTALADSTTRVINPGTVGTPISPGHGTICADVYVFDNTQEMIECCSCPITANGILQLSLLNDLTQNPLTGFPAPNSGVIKIVADDARNCNETAPLPTPQLLAWQTHTQQPTSGTFVTTEDEFQHAFLTDDEWLFLGQACSFVQYLGSGKGVCQCGATS